MFWLEHDRADAIWEAECRAAGQFLNERIVAATTEAALRSSIPVKPHEINERDGLGDRLRWYCWSSNVLLVYTMNIDHDRSQVVISTPSHRSIGKKYSWQVIEPLGPTPPSFLEHLTWIRPAESKHTSAVGLRTDLVRTLEIYRAESVDESIELAKSLIALFPGVDYVVTKPTEL